MTQDIQAQLADLQNDADFDAWADARCAEYEAEADARHCLGGANDARSQGWVECSDEESAYYAELERKAEYDAWTEADEAEYQAEQERIYRANARIEMMGYRF